MKSAFPVLSVTHMKKVDPAEQISSYHKMEKNEFCFSATDNVQCQFAVHLKKFKPMFQ